MKNHLRQWIPCATILGWLLNAPGPAAALPAMHMQPFDDLFVAPLSTSGAHADVFPGQTWTLPPNPSSSALWTADAKLLGLGSQGTDLFGNAVAVDGDTVLVGAPSTTANGVFESGAAYVFVLSGNTWTQQAKFVADDAAAYDHFGSAVALAGDVAVIGAPGVTDLGTGSGSAYVFVRNGTTWTQQAKLLPASAGQDSWMGYALDTDGTTILLGAPSAGMMQKEGTVYVFERNGNTWTESGPIVANGIALRDAYGGSVALSGNRLLIGAPGTDGNAMNDGAAYVFERIGTTWSEQAQLVSPNRALNAAFGSTVALNGTTALVREAQPVGKPPNSGVVYAFEYDGTTWVYRATLEGSDSAANDFFGFDIAVSGNRAVVSATNADVGSNENAGGAYVFAQTNTTWTPLEKIVEPMVPAAYAYFASSVALANEWMIIGRPGSGVATSPGSAYVFREQLLKQGVACTQSVECANGLSCVDGVCCDSTCGGGLLGDCLACSTAAGAAVNGICGPAITGTVCRYSVSVCDAKEVCDGVSNDCPVDVNVPGCMDSDFDGLSDTDEVLFGTDPLDSDSDGDGVIDGAEVDWNVDTDKDGLINALDTDSDNDGLSDGIESKPNGTSPVDPDSDDDCIFDGAEDIDHDGVVDPGEMNPLLRDYDGFCCASDLDCGTKTSGQICALAPRCRDGCRGKNGNGCPDGTICTSIDESAGSCVAISPGDGGAGGTSEAGGAGGGGSGSGGFDVTVNPNGCSCRMLAHDEVPMNHFVLGACAAIAAWRRNRRIRRVASAIRGATTALACGEES